MDPIVLQQAFDLAVEYHQANRLTDAEKMYRLILADEPQHPDAIHLLGVIALQVRRHDAAIDMFRRAISLRPNFPDAHYNLGIALRESGKIDEAMAAFREAITLRPYYGPAHNNLGIALAERGELDQAIASYQQAISVAPEDADAHNNLGITLTRQGKTQDAIAAFRQAVATRPDYAEAHNNLGNALKDAGQLDEAIAAYRQAIALRPGSAQPHHNLAITLEEKGQLNEAIAAGRQAVLLMPGSAEAYNHLGAALKEKGDLNDAIAAFRQAIFLRPEYAEAQNNLGTTLKDQGQFDEAIAAFRQLIALRPVAAEPYNNLGSALADAGQLSDALAAYRQALALRPDYAEAHSNIVFTLLYDPAADSQTIADELRRWDQQHAQPLRKFIPIHQNDRDPNRRLRIGYVSPDFRDHVVGRNLLPLFLNHDRKQFDITCYAQVPRPDAMTQRFQQLSDHWRSIVGQSHEKVAEQIHADQIDILVDLSLHTSGNRLPVFARKPAPIAVSFAGYPGSTGLSAIDYRLSDPYLDPPGSNDSSPPEQTIRLPHSFWCYDPLDDREIPVNDLPANKNGYITFGCLNNFSKINDDIFTLWSQILRQVENSRLLLLAQHGSHRQRTLDRISHEGIDPQRVEFIPFQPRRDYLQLYHRIDIGLDTFPYNGHTTSLDSFWMGVPVITLVGHRPVSRAGWSQLSNLGLTELAGHKEEQFMQIAVELARDLPRLAELRASLRNRMEQSPLIDAQKFARGIESAYRQMWHAWIK